MDPRRSKCDDRFKRVVRPDLGGYTSQGDNGIKDGRGDIDETLVLVWGDYWELSTEGPQLENATFRLKHCTGNQ